MSSCFDKTSFLAQESGKVKAVRNLGIEKVIVVGDGWTDYEIKKTGNAERFLAFSENVNREKVTEVADAECFDLEQVIENIKSPK